MRAHLHLQLLSPSSANAADAVPTDQDLIARIRKGDQAAFEALVTKYCAELRRYLSTFVDSPAAAEELVQDLFLTIWRMGEAWQVRTSLRSYLFRSAHNLGLGYWRHQRVIHRWTAQVSRTDERPAMGRVSGPTQQLAEWSEMRSVLAAAIARMPKRCRQVADLRFQHDLSHAEIAEVMGITVKAVERQIGKALKVLRVVMAPYL